MPNSIFAPVRERVLLASSTPVANTATTNWAFMVPTNSAGDTVIRGGTLANNGDTILIKVKMSLSAATSTRAYQVAIGYTSTGNAGFTGGLMLNNNGSASSSQDIWGELYIIRTSPGHQIYGSMFQFGGSAAQSQQQTTATLDETIDQTIALGIQDGTGNLAAITANMMEIRYIPAP